jgi:hypothetical protein
VKTYQVTFDRIGRNHDVAPLTAEAGDAGQLAEVIYRYARPHLVSRDIEVSVDLGAGKGYVFAGIQTGATFTITEVEEPAYPAPGSTIPDQPGYVVGKCEHRVAKSEWRAGFRTCERCPEPSHEVPA